MSKLQDAIDKRKRKREKMRNKPKGKRHALKNLIDKLTAFIKRLRAEKNALGPIAVNKSYYPGGIGGFAGGGHKIVWHTTEGSSAGGAIGAYRASGSYPHFTLGEDGTVYQHAPLTSAVTALAHPSGPETNRANAIQVEIVGFASQSGQWSDSRYAQIARLARYIEENANVPRRRSVSFSRPAKLSGDAFYNVSGHVGHVHAPGNDHTDPGAGFQINKVI